MDLRLRIREETELETVRYLLQLEKTNGIEHEFFKSIRTKMVVLCTNVKYWGNEGLWASEMVCKQMNDGKGVG